MTEATTSDNRDRTMDGLFAEVNSLLQDVYFCRLMDSYTPDVERRRHSAARAVNAMWVRYHLDVSETGDGWSLAELMALRDDARCLARRVGLLGGSQTA